MHSSNLILAVTKLHQADLRAQATRDRWAAESRRSASTRPPRTSRRRFGRAAGDWGMGRGESPRLGDVGKPCVAKTHGIQ